VALRANRHEASRFALRPSAREPSEIPLALPEGTEARRSSSNSQAPGHHRKRVLYRGSSRPMKTARADLALARNGRARHAVHAHSRRGRTERHVRRHRRRPLGLIRTTNFSRQTSTRRKKQLLGAREADFGFSKTQAESFASGSRTVCSTTRCSPCGKPGPRSSWPRLSAESPMATDSTRSPPRLRRRPSRPQATQRSFPSSLKTVFSPGNRCGVLQGSIRARHKPGHLRLCNRQVGAGPLSQLHHGRMDGLSICRCNAPGRRMGPGTRPHLRAKSHARAGACRSRRMAAQIQP